MSTKAKNKKGAKNKTFETRVSSSLISSMITDPPILQYHFNQKNIAILLVMSPQNSYIFPFARNVRKFSPTIIGHYFWNDLPHSIRFRPTKELFKNSLFRHYLSQY